MVIIIKVDFSLKISGQKKSPVAGGRRLSITT